MQHVSLRLLTADGEYTFIRTNERWRRDWAQTINNLPGSQHFFGDYSFKMMAVWHVVKKKQNWVIIRKSYSRRSNENDRPKQIAPQQFLSSHVSPQLKTHTHKTNTKNPPDFVLCLFNPVTTFCWLSLWPKCCLHQQLCSTPLLKMPIYHPDCNTSPQHQLIERLNKQKVRIRMIFSSFKDFEEFSDLPTLQWIDLKFQWRFYNTTAVTSMTYSALKCLSPSALLCRRLWCIGHV